MRGEAYVERGPRWRGWALWGCLVWMGAGCDTTVPPELPEAPADVLVKGVTRYHTSSGETSETPMDFSEASFELQWLEGETFKAVEGTPTGAGQVVFKEVPDGPYYLKHNRENRYIVTDARTVDLSDNLLGRADARVPSYGSFGDVLLNIDGLEPWSPPAPQDFNRLQFLSEELGTSGYLYVGDTLQEGQTSASGVVMSMNLSKLLIFEAERGDRAWLTQSIPRTVVGLTDGRSWPYQSVARSLSLAPFSYDYDYRHPLAVSGSFQPLPMTQLSLDWRLSSFSALAAGTNPEAYVGASSLFVSPGPYWWRFTKGYTAELLSLGFPSGHTSDFQGTLEYGNPYPAHWEPVGQVASSFFTRHILPYARETLFLRTSITVSDTLANLSAQPIQPRVLPPRDLRVDGETAYSSYSRLLSGGSHVLSWQPPASGVPSAYRLTVFSFVVVHSGFVLGDVPVELLLEGHFTSLTLPPELLKPDKFFPVHYALRLEAISSPGYSVADQNTLWHLPYDTASTVSGIFTVQ